MLDDSFRWEFVISWDWLLNWILASEVEPGKKFSKLKEIIFQRYIRNLANIHLSTTLYFLVLNLFINLKLSYKWYEYLKIMNKKASHFNDFLIATLLAVIRSNRFWKSWIRFWKIVDGLTENGLMKNEKFEDEGDIAA